MGVLRNSYLDKSFALLIEPLTLPPPYGYNIHSYFPRTTKHLTFAFAFIVSALRQGCLLFVRARRALASKISLMLSRKLSKVLLNGALRLDISYITDSKKGINQFVLVQSCLKRGGDAQPSHIAIFTKLVSLSNCSEVAWLISKIAAQHSQ